MNRIKRMLAPPVFEDEEKTRVASLLNSILVATFILATLLTLAAALLYGARPIALIASGIIAVLTLTLQSVMRSGHVKLADWLLPR